MPYFDVNEWYIDRRARCVVAPGRAHAPIPSRHVRITPRHYRLTGSTS